MMNNVELKVDGKIFSGWTSVTVNRSIETMAGYFDLGVNVQTSTDLSSLAPGKPFTLSIDGQTVITGYTDGRRRQMGADSMKITIAGRDKTADLIDCAAIYKGGQWKKRTLEQIARDLCQPYGVAVRWELTDAESAAPFTSFTLDHSETVYEALGRAARARGVLITSNAAGDLVFTRADESHSDRLVLGENLLSVDFDEDYRDRFSEYTVKGHGRSNGKVGDTVDARTIASQKGTATDSEITRYRPMIILADSKIDAQSATARALREQRRRLAKSVTFEAQLDGWTRSNGQIWMPNILAEIDASKFAIQTGPLLVSKVVLTLDDREGVKTTLTLAPRDGFLVPVEKDRKGKSSGSNASAGGIDALAEEYYRNHPEKRP
ncbi:baseplate protein [Salmonella enterica subsp. enterica serovar Braenderup]|uniref:phage baseplate assembly protein n=1 Tax=Enterobacteriaceae TaxID=543 RepID=UPI00070EC66A|nr:contractile injection system protein, VgrG/Pvc8 family [Citrobacter koseri]EAZ2565726.1 baseplate protein [Salmonella enterica]ECJ3933828.1 baseplate protein [Salmonella enterica subsp. enterica]EDR6297466.1 baseplate protein [Salmonella enterica subsp. enterica serovar Berkeley]EHW7283729.1 baseplate protein [Salmonella enterica subsp. enterica serovar Bispebjerg]EKG5889127.1 baseplate protein [Salmonella enterica subsp. enterica serovar Braenderup]HEC6157290.1 baseplate protein [Salmonel